MAPRGRQPSSSSSSARNSVGGGGQQQLGYVGKFLSGSCDHKLRVLATLITADDTATYFTEDRLRELKDEIQRLAQLSATICNEEKETKRVVDMGMERFKPNKQARHDGSSSSSSSSSSSAADDDDGANAATIAAAMKDLLQQNTSAFDPTKTAFVKEIAVLFGQVGGDDDDDVVVREVESDDTYRCPITTQKIVNPVTNGVCKHVATKDAVMQMLRNAKNKAECKCFMTGCNAMWKADTVREDSVFQDKMDAWFRRQSQRNTIAAQGSNNNAIDIENDDDDNEYTQV